MTVGIVGSADHVRALKRCRAALVAAFLITGLGMSTWITRTPAIRDTMELSNAEMGLLLAAVAVGSVAGIALGNPFLAFRGVRFVVGCGMLSHVDRCSPHRIGNRPAIRSNGKGPPMIGFP